MNIKQFLNDYSNKCSKIICQQQEALILLGCHYCGNSVVQDEKIIKGTILQHEPLNLLGTVVCYGCRKKQALKWYKENIVNSHKKSIKFAIKDKK